MKIVRCKFKEMRSNEVKEQYCSEEDSLADEKMELKRNWHWKTSKQKWKKRKKKKFYLKKLSEYNRWREKNTKSQAENSSSSRKEKS